MSGQLKGLLYFQTANVQKSFIIFWSILSVSAFVSFLIATFTMTSGNSMVMFFSAAVYIFALFIGFQQVKLDVIYAIKLGATRKNIFISTAIFFLGLSFISAILISVLHQFITFLTTTFDIDTYRTMHMASLLNDTWLNRIIIDTSLMFFFLALLFIFGLLFYRFGLVGGGSVGAGFIILMLVAMGTGWLQDTLIGIAETFTIGFFFEVILVGIGIYIISWIFLRRITILMEK